jgi:8-hydroxy-5-deazaflavin:NADPH oxidoreductase
VIRAFNTIAAALIDAEPREGRGRRVIFISGNDAMAKTELGHVLEQLGFAPVDLGDLVTGCSMQQLGAPLALLNLLKVP